MPFRQRERPGLLAASQRLHITAPHEEPLTELPRSKPSGPDPAAYGLRGSSRELCGSSDIQLSRAISATPIFYHMSEDVVESKKRAGGGH
jgi:hypothetical protein